MMSFSKVSTERVPVCRELPEVAVRLLLTVTVVGIYFKHSSSSSYISFRVM